MEHSILSFLINYLSDLNIHHQFVQDRDIGLSSLDLGLRDSILCLKDPVSSPPISSIAPETVYHIRDFYNCNYSFFPLPDQSLFFAGPYLTEPIEESDIHNFLDFSVIPKELFPQLRDYYYELPYLADKHAFFSLLRNIYKTVYSCENVISVFLDLKETESTDDYLKKHQFQVPKDPVLSMHLLENRYTMEDEILDAVAHGNTAKALSYVQTIGTIRFVPRTGNKQRDQKNLMLTFNSLLRRTAYTADVHPFYIDAVSSNYARMIEQASLEDTAKDIIPYMVQSYCNLVEKRNMSSYSEPVRQILVTIDASLIGDLSLKRFANELFLNTSYLSALFKKEVGITLTDYVNKNRIAYAKKLLKSTSLSIQDVATQSGIPDIHYFTRLFRRDTGMTPREFRSA